VPHGGWLPWLAEVGLSPRTAQRYMRLATLPADKYDTVTHLGIAAALDAIATHAPTMAAEVPWRRPIEEGEIEISLDQVKFRAEVYPRTAVPIELVDRYAELLPYLDAIEVNQNYEIIDGYLRLLAHQHVNTLDTIRCRVTQVENEREHLELAIRRNATHAEPLPLGAELAHTIARWRERMLALGITVTANSMQFPDDLPFEQWQAVAEDLAAFAKLTGADEKLRR